MDWLARVYPTFERLVALVLLAGMVVVIALATWSFVQTTGLTAAEAGRTLDYTRFQVLFDRVLAAIIALELAHSVHQMVLGHHGFVQVKTVLLIGLLAVVRKLILLEIESTTGMFLIGIAGAVLALGIVFALVHYVERFQTATDLPSPGAGPSDDEAGPPNR